MDAAVASDAATASGPAASTPAPDVPSDMNMGAITIAFTNNVGVNLAAMGGSILDHITVTEDGLSASPTSCCRIRRRTCRPRR